VCGLLRSGVCRSGSFRGGRGQLRSQLEKDLAQTQRRLEAAEKARDAAIKSLEQAALRGTSTTGRHTPRS